MDRMRIRNEGGCGRVTDGQVMKGRNNRYYNIHEHDAGGRIRMVGWMQGEREEYRFPGICLSLFFSSFPPSFSLSSAIIDSAIGVTNRNCTHCIVRRGPS